MFNFFLESIPTAHNFLCLLRRLPPDISPYNTAKVCSDALHVVRICTFGNYAYFRPLLLKSFEF